jgi:hypothetical protein
MLPTDTSMIFEETGVWNPVLHVMLPSPTFMIGELKSGDGIPTGCP